MDEQQREWDRRYSLLKSRPAARDAWLEPYAGLLEESRGIPVIDLGCGLGNDTGFLLERGYRVIACDYSQEAIDGIALHFPAAERRVFDMRGGLPFADASARAVIADLSLHYFPWAQTLEIAAELRRVLAGGGLLFCRLNSVRDRKHGAGKGEEIEPNFYRRDGACKRFFDAEQLSGMFSEGWAVLHRAEKSLSRYLMKKRLWEIVLRKTA